MEVSPPAILFLIRAERCIRDMLPPLSLMLRSGGFLFDSPIGLSISRLSPRAPRFFLSP